MRTLNVDGLRFAVETPVEHWRVQTLLTKEEGTIRWLQRVCRPDDIFLDVGANIGIYTIFAARLVRYVIAVEPHLGNAISLLKNVDLNDGRVMVVTDALGDITGWFPFHYQSLVAGTSGSQLGHTRLEDGGEFRPARTVSKFTTTVDALGFEPTLVKIDVDGNEPDILRGMAKLLTQRPPRSIQVEVHRDTRDLLDTMLTAYGYRLVERHHTAQGKKRIADGAAELDVAHNAVYEVI